MSEIQVPTARKLLHQLIEEVDQFEPEMFIPSDPRRKSETLIGVVTDDFCKKLYSMASFYRREGRRLEVDLDEAGTPKEESTELLQFKSKHDILMEIFWHLLKTNYHAWYPSVGIRKNWEFIQQSGSDEVIAGIFKRSEIPKLLRKIMEDLND
jgi:hypothetical protein